jgi:hypothetical protein
VGLVTALLSPRLRQPKGTPPSAIALWREYLGGLDGLGYREESLEIAATS